MLLAIISSNDLAYNLVAVEELFKEKQDEI
jgi:hypothetical protein